MFRDTSSAKTSARSSALPSSSPLPVLRADNDPGRPFKRAVSRSAFMHFRADLKGAANFLDELKVRRATARHFQQPVGGLQKRAADLVIAVLAMIAVAPLALVVAAVLKITTGGPVLFRHKRIGHHGTEFDCYKFRTMVPDAERVLEEHLARDPLAADEWRRTRKLRNDPRVTRIGQILRTSSLDELPQLINVLKGEMSIVGPRPIVSEELEFYGLHASEYLRARPGITGPWQVNGRSNLAYDERVTLDCHYVRNWSFWTDLTIFARTLPVVLKSDGSH